MFVEKFSFEQKLQTFLLFQKLLTREIEFTFIFPCKQHVCQFQLMFFALLVKKLFH